MLERCPHCNHPLTEQQATSNPFDHAVLAATAAVTGVPIAEFLGTTHSKTTTRARYIAGYVLRERRKLSYPEIGKILRRDHSSVITALHYVRRRLEEDDALRHDIREVMRISTSPQPGAAEPLP